MRTAQRYAKLNRATMAAVALKFFDQSPGDTEPIETVHNYISFDDNIILFRNEYEPFGAPVLSPDALHQP